MPLELFGLTAKVAKAAVYLLPTNKAVGMYDICRSFIYYFFILLQYLNEKLLYIRMQISIMRKKNLRNLKELIIMSIFLYILGNNIVPIFILIVLGFIISKKFDLSIFTLSKLNFYIFIPGFVFFNLYTANLSFDMLKIILFCILYLIANDLISRIISKIRKYDVGQTSAFKNSIMFNNTGNIGVSLITLIFSSAPFVIDGNTPYLNQALATQIVIMVFMFNPT